MSWFIADVAHSAIYKIVQLAAAMMTSNNN